MRNKLQSRRYFCSLFDTSCNFLECNIFATLRYFPLRDIFGSDVFDCKEFSTQRHSCPWLQFFPPPDIFHPGFILCRKTFSASISWLSINYQSLKYEKFEKKLSYHFLDRITYTVHAPL